MFKLNSMSSKTDGFKIVEKGDSYGRNGALTHDKEEAMIELYVGDWFISRYYISTFLDVANGGNGLCLMGDAREYDIDARDVFYIASVIRNELSI